MLSCDTGVNNPYGASAYERETHFHQVLASPVSAEADPCGTHAISQLLPERNVARGAACARQTLGWPRLRGNAIGRCAELLRSSLIPAWAARCRGTTNLEPDGVGQEFINLPKKAPVCAHESHVAAPKRRPWVWLPGQRSAEQGGGGRARGGGAAAPPALVSASPSWAPQRQ